MTHNSHTAHGGYSSGHPWYYLLGGAVLTPKQIREETRQSGYQGYAANDIHAADRKIEPQRSAALRKLKAKFEADLANDITTYRQRALELHRYRLAADPPTNPSCCSDIHTSMSLKHNHIVNAFGHLLTIDAMLNVQADLFG